MFRPRQIKYGHTAIFTVKIERESANGPNELEELNKVVNHLVKLEIGRFGNSRRSVSEDWIDIKVLGNTTTEDPLFLHLRIIGSKLGSKERPQYVINSAEVYMNIPS